MSSTRISGEITSSIAAHIARYSEHPKESPLEIDARGITVTLFLPVALDCRNDISAVRRFDARIRSIKVYKTIGKMEKGQ